MQLEAVASALGALLPDVNFMGGSATVLLVEASAHSGVRHTGGVDLIGFGSIFT